MVRGWWEARRPTGVAAWHGDESSGMAGIWHLTSGGAAHVSVLSCRWAAAAPAHVAGGNLSALYEPSVASHSRIPPLRWESERRAARR